MQKIFWSFDDNVKSSVITEKDNTTKFEILLTFDPSPEISIFILSVSGFTWYLMYQIISLSRLTYAPGIFAGILSKWYLQINTWAFPYWPGYHIETPHWPSTASRANMCRGMMTRPIWKCPCIKLFITYFDV